MSVHEHEEFISKYSQVTGALIALNHMDSPSAKRVFAKAKHTLKPANLPDGHVECMKIFEEVLKDICTTIASQESSTNEFETEDEEPTEELTPLEIRNAAGRKLTKSSINNMLIDLHTSVDVDKFLENL
jgi:hypothetical protein